MSAMLLPAGGEHAGANSSDSSRDQSQGHRTRHERGSPQIPTVEELLAKMAKLPALIAMGLLSPGQANSIRATCQALLAYLNRDAKPGTGAALPMQELEARIRANPQLATLFADLLPDEVIDDLLRGEG